MHKIAILTDSCCDVPEAFIKPNVFVVPLEIHYKDHVYLDGVNISAEEVYAHFKNEIPKTSLPSGASIKDKIDELIQAGYDEVVGVSISSGLSGTYNMVSLMLQDYPQLKSICIDTKSIGIGSGFSVIRVNELIEANYSLEKISEIMQQQIIDTKVFFCVATLEYLQKGGRIGLVSATLGTMLDLKPIISCNEEGVYHTLAKQRGRKQSLTKAIEIVIKYIGDTKDYSIAVVNGDAAIEANEVKEKILSLLPNARNIIEGQIGPGLVVHTGPGLIGIIVQKNNKI